MGDTADINEARVCRLIDELIIKLELHEADERHRSFGHLQHLIEVVKDAQSNKRFRDPLFFVNTPRWLGEWGNTPLEQEINSIAGEINKLTVEICGGSDVVNAARHEHNQKVLRT